VHVNASSHEKQSAIDMKDKWIIVTALGVMRSLHCCLSQLRPRAVNCQMLRSAAVLHKNQLELQLCALTGPDAPAVHYALVETKTTVHCCVTGEVLLNFHQISFRLFFLLNIR
jgi:hypothetical protein